jgi:hypothetical protein
VCVAGRQRSSQFAVARIVNVRGAEQAGAKRRRGLRQRIGIICARMFGLIIRWLALMEICMRQPAWFFSQTDLAEKREAFKRKRRIGSQAGNRLLPAGAILVVQAVWNGSVVFEKLKNAELHVSRQRTERCTYTHLCSFQHDTSDVVRCHPLRASAAVLNQKFPEPLTT